MNARPNVQKYRRPMEHYLDGVRQTLCRMHDRTGVSTEACERHLEALALAVSEVFYPPLPLEPASRPHEGA